MAKEIIPITPSLIAQIIAEAMVDTIRQEQPANGNESDYQQVIIQRQSKTIESLSKENAELRQKYRNVLKAFGEISTQMQARRDHDDELAARVAEILGVE